MKPGKMAPNANVWSLRGANQRNLGTDIFVSGPGVRDGDWERLAG